MFKKIARGKLNAFLQKWATKERVLDIGSGGSTYSTYFPNRLTVDYDSERKPDVVADILDMPFKDGEFNFILCTEVLEHVTDPAQAIAELYRVLSDDGILLLTTRFVYPIHDAPNDYWRFTKFGLQHLFKGWGKVDIEADTENFETFAVLLQRMAFQTKLRFNKISKLFLFCVAKIMPFFNKCIIEEYGDIKKSRIETGIFASGYCVVASKTNNFSKK